MQFTASQKQAIGHRTGHLQLIACAGSGKTEVVAQRVVNLLRPRKEGAAAQTSLSNRHFRTRTSGAHDCKAVTYALVDVSTGAVHADASGRGDRVESRFAKSLRETASVHVIALEAERA